MCFEWVSIQGSFQLQHLLLLRKSRFLDEQLLDDLNVKWYPKDFEPWSIEPSGAGVIAITQSKDGTRAAKFSFLTNGTPILTIEDKRSDIDNEWLSTALAAVERVVAFDLDLPKGRAQGKPTQ